MSEFYINQDLQRATEVTGLSEDELEMIVGRFMKHSCRAGQLRGKVCEEYTRKHGERVVIRHHFNNKMLWEG